MSEAGRRAFEAYSAAVEGRTHDGKPIPRWEELSDRVRAGWSETAHLMSSPANAARLTESIASFEAQERRVRAEWTRDIASMLRGMTKVPPEVRPGLVYAANFLDPPQVTVEVVDDADPLDTPTESEWQVTEHEQRCACLGIPGCHCRP